MRSKLSITFVSAIFLMVLAIPTHSAALTIPGTSDPWLAGMPNGSLDNVGTPEPADAAPTYSPVMVTGITITPGVMLQWMATGQVGHPGDVAGPDGASSYITSHTVGANNGISDILAPIDSLLGVFLGPNQPNLSSAPGQLDFSSAANRDYLTLNPQLQQVFFMGDGFTSGFLAQTIIAPAGATRLYLGTMDGYGWANNIGAFEITMSAVPEPSTMLLLSLGLIGLAGVRRFKNYPQIKLVQKRGKDYEKVFFFFICYNFNPRQSGLCCSCS